MGTNKKIEETKEKTNISNERLKTMCYIYCFISFFLFLHSCQLLMMFCHRM